MNSTAQQDNPRTTADPDRRDFLKTSTGALIGAGLAGGLSVARSAHAAGDDTLKVGLIGCGGRGSGAALDALNADPNVKLVAVGDAFENRMREGLANITKEAESSGIGAKIAVDESHKFVGFDAYQKVIDSGVDVVILATPPHFRPAHLAAAVAAKKHVFCEKPVAVDGPGVRSVLETCQQAGQLGLSIVSGLCYRYDIAKREIYKRIHDGAIGDIVAMHVSYNTGPLWNHGRGQDWSDMEWQVRNWLYFHWLSGDHIVEQHIHSIDKAAWAMRDEPPLRVTGMGGREVRTGPEYGNIYDHFACVFEYASGAKLFTNCRQQAGCPTDVNDHLIGTKGSCQVMKHEIEGQNRFDYRGPKGDMYQQEHNELFASIRSGKPINNGEYMARSTLMAIMGRMAAYTGQNITWQQALNSQEKLGPAKYEWGSLSVDPIAKPGVTPFV